MGVVECSDDIVVGVDSGALQAAPTAHAVAGKDDGAVCVDGGTLQAAQTALAAAGSDDIVMGLDGGALRAARTAHAGSVPPKGVSGDNGVNEGKVLDSAPPNRVASRSDG
eukprot:9373705-Alexandrium_andersonii.AAC.1